MPSIPHRLLRRVATDVLKGGKSDKIPPSAFPADKVNAGAKVESEHTSNKTMAKEIARDHLTEDMNYYEKLKKMEKKAGRDTITVSAQVDPREVKALVELLKGLRIANNGHSFSVWVDPSDRLHRIAQGSGLAPIEYAASKHFFDGDGSFYIGDITMAGVKVASKQKKGEWDQAVLQMPERSFEPKVPNQDPWNRKKKTKQADAFFDEMLKISFKVSGKGALIGGAIGAGLGGLSALRHELKERDWDNRSLLSDEEKSALRKIRRKGHLIRVGVGAGTGLIAGGSYKAIGDAAAAVAKNIRHKVQPEINQAVSDTAQEGSKHLDTLGAKAKEHAKGVGEAAGTAAAEKAREHFKFPTLRELLGRKKK